MEKLALKTYLSDKYQGWDSFCETIVLPIFGKDNYEDKRKKEVLDMKPERRLLADATGIKSVKFCAQTYVSGEPLQFFDITVSDKVMMNRNRVNVQKIIRSVMDQYSSAFMIFHYEDESKWEWRFSFCYKSENEDESTDRKRYTFLLGPGQSCRTAAENFMALYGKQQNDEEIELEDLINAFNVEALSNEFFNGYKKIYEDIIEYVTGKRMVKVNNKWEEKVIHDPNEEIMSEFARFANPEKAVRDYVKKLMGRLVFLQFLQKKGWLGVKGNERWGEGSPTYIKDLFNQTEDKDNFIDNMLEALFNDLNTERTNDLVSPVLGDNIRVPYLNGGLFERDEADETRFPLPAEFMERMLFFFSCYNFTIDENDPNDAEVGVDPEMLGRIFENLLEDNKDKGAFYTPKEIVTYMCRESLIACLQTDVDDEATKEAIRKFVTNHDSTLLGDIANDIDQRLKDVKICDPAIGSGAFPMGLLKELFLCRSAIEGFDQSTATEIKKHIIQNNIYGVDIEKGAVDISRLRFWLSLIVDEENPQALPNLDFKIMRGNSLLEQYNGFDLSTIMRSKKKVEGPVQMTFFEDDIDVLRRQVIALRREYFRETDKKKKKNLRQRMREIVQQQINALSYDIDLSGIDIADNSEFFLWHTWFSDVFENGGFDIVIANPPYIDSESMTNQGMGNLREILVTKFGLSGNWDIYMAFFEQSFTISRNVVCFITPDKWLSKPFGYKFRATRLKGQMKSILRAGSKVFENATVDAIISLFTMKSDMLRTLKFNEKKQIELITQIDKSLLVEPYYIDYLFSNSVSIIEKVERNNMPLSQIATCENACATSDCYALLPYIHNDSQVDSNAYKLINTGTIGRYRSRWGEKECTYLKHKFLYPIVNIKEFESAADLGKSYKKRARLPKIIMKGLNLMDACIDEDAKILPGKTTLVIHSDNMNCLYLLLAILNSNVASFYIKTKYSSSSYCGGITFTKDMINQMPVPYKKEMESAIINKVKDIIRYKTENSIYDTSVMESDINSLVYQLYGLSEEDIKIIEQS